MHISSNSGRAVAAPQAAHTKHIIVHRPDAEPPQLCWHTSGHGAALLQSSDVLERKTAVMVVFGSAGHEIGCMLFRECGEALAWWGQRLQGKVHNRPPQLRIFFLRECGMIVNPFLRWSIHGPR